MGLLQDFFLPEKQNSIFSTEAYLGPYKTSRKELFCERSFNGF